MREIGLFEAKNKLSELVEAARAGEEVVLTKRGAPVAKLVGLTAPGAALREAMAALDARREARKGGKLKRGEVLELIRAGRKY
jgi:prevent-host-death family protein